MPNNVFAAANFDRNEVGIALIALGMIAVGAFLILTPPQHILSSDRKTGYWLYRSEMKISGDEKRAIAAAGYFYKAFGVALIVLGALLLCILIFL